MKYIKTFENLNMPEIGDYILYGSKNPDWDIPKTDYHKYLQTHIGKLFDYIPDRDVIYIEFDELPESINVYSAFYDGETGKRYGDNIQIDSNKNTISGKYYALAGYKILYHSKNKEDIESILNANKYNL